MFMTEAERDLLIGALIIANPNYKESYFIDLSDDDLVKEYDRLMNKE